MFSFLFDPINISLIVTALLNLLLGALIFINGKNKKINIVFSLNIVAVISWVMAMFFYRSSLIETNLIWCTILYVAPTLIASSFLYFTYIFPSQKEKYIWWRAILIFGINLAIIIMVIWPGLIIKEVNIRSGLEKQIIFTSYYWFYFLYTLLFFSFGFSRLFTKYLRNRGIERLQIIYLVTGYALSANLAFVTNLIMPWVGLFFINWLGQIFTLIGVASTTYAILKYRLMDIRIMFRKTVIYFVLAGFVFGMFYLVTWMYNTVFGSVFNNGAYLLGLIVAPLFVALFAWLNKKTKGFANKYLFFSLYSDQETIAKLTDELTNSIDLNKIVDSIVGSIKQAMQLDKAEVLLIEQNTDNFLIQYLQKTQKPLVRDEIQNLNQLSESMKNIGAALCLPMVISNKLIGIIVLGNKVSGDAYTKEDLELLTTLSKQAAIALDNARLYKEVQDFSKTLQQKVDEQTKDIKEAYEIEKQAKEDLEKTDEVKNQFMAIANHHLRTPLTAINWYIDLILSGKYGKVSVKLKDIINRINISTTDEIKIVDDLLNVSQFQLGKEIIEANQKVNIEKMFSQIKENEEPEIQQKNIFIKINKLNEIPLIPADESKLKVALANIVDNAVKYTEKGGVTITLEIEKFKNLKITVRDTGMGMNETELENIFIKTFERGTEAQKLFATGKGIGLYLSAKIIEAHHGKIWAESAGKNKGSAFHIELPA